MFKEITAISKNYAIVKIDNVINDDLLNLNVIFEENNKKILGEIEEIINSEAKITFLGEFINDKFFDGIIRKPSINAKIRIINGNELAELTGYNDSTAMMLGLSPLYNNSPVKINIDDMWSNHTAIFGNTGSGKTYGVARLVQNLFTMPNYIPFNSVIFIFNNTDEYDNAFKSINSYNFNFNYKMFSTDTDSNNNILKVVDSWNKKVLNNNNGTLYYNSDYKIVKCNLDNNKNLYVGTNEMAAEDLCVKENEKTAFKRTYQVLNITDSDNEEYWFLTLKEYQVDEVVTVKVKKEINPNLKEKKSYVFEFEFNGACITDELKWILENTDIVGIKSTDKIGMDAIRDEVNTCN